MKRTFIKMLPVVAAVLLATSCSKDGNDDNITVAPAPVETQNIASPTESSPTESKTIHLAITVNKDGNSLSKASVEVGSGEANKTTYTQTFIEGDVLVISNSEVLNKEAIFTMKSVGEDKTTATFEGDLSVKEGVKLVQGETELNAVLKNTGSDASKHNSGKPVEGVQEVSSLKEGFEKYGYLTADNFTYEGDETSIQLVQNTVFLRIKPFNGAKTASVNGTTYTAQEDGVIYLAVKSGTEIESKLWSGKKTVTAEGGKVIKNIDRSDCLPGAFTINSNGDQVHFSKGNLQYNVRTKVWRFAGNQYDYVGDYNEGNVMEGRGFCTNIDIQGPWIDLFGWVGRSGSLNDAATKYGVSTEKDAGRYGTQKGEPLKSDWGKVFGEDSPWRTLTGGDLGEWRYLIDYHSTTSGVRFARANVAGVNGLIIVPDDWKNESPYYLASYNQSNAAYTSNKISPENWERWETAGAVFLPAAGCRDGSNVFSVCSLGCYWSSSANGTDFAFAFGLYFSSDLSVTRKPLDPAASPNRYYGESVRLVRPL